jgi:hypothetical protein
MLDTSGIAYIVLVLCESFGVSRTAKLSNTFVLYPAAEFDALRRTKRGNVIWFLKYNLDSYQHDDYEYMIICRQHCLPNKIATSSCGVASAVENANTSDMRTCQKRENTKCLQARPSVKLLIPLSHHDGM